MPSANGILGRWATILWIRYTYPYPYSGKNCEAGVFLRLRYLVYVIYIMWLNSWCISVCKHSCSVPYHAGTSRPGGISRRNLILGMHSAVANWPKSGYESLARYHNRWVYRESVTLQPVVSDQSGISGWASATYLGRAVRPCIVVHDGYKCILLHSE